MNLVLILFICISSYFQGIEGDDEASGCYYRNHSTLLRPDIFSLWACWGCYNYLQRHASGSELTVQQCSKDNFIYPCYNESLYFDYKNKEMVDIISKTCWSTNDAERWLDCCIAADECCYNKIENTKNKSLGTCKSLWDGWQCWDESYSGTVAYGSCPKYIYTSDEQSCDLESRKICYENDTWDSHTDYSSCSHLTRLKFRNYYHIIVLSIGIIVTLPAFIIYISFRKIRHLTRIIQHRNLILAIITRNIIVILIKLLVVINGLNATSPEYSNMADNSSWCRVLSTLDKLLTNFVFACMTLESVYLHRILALAFKGQPKMTIYYLIAIALCFSFMLTWAIIMASKNDYYCWILDYNNLNTHWINNSFRLILLLINFILLIDIIRILCTRLHTVHANIYSKTKRTIKATIFLTPVFGIQFFITAVPPNTRDCPMEQFYYLLSYTLEASLGPLVAILYCYTNREIKILIKQFWADTYEVVLTTDMVEIESKQKVIITT